MKILLAITCYNCQKQIVRVLSKLACANVLTEITHVAVIDNRSSDTTVENALTEISSSSLKNKACIYLNEENYGLGGSHKVAFDLALAMGMDYVFILHGDDQADVDDMKLFLDAQKKFPGRAAFLGSRFLSDSTLIGYQKKRIFGNKALNMLYTILTLKKVSDLGSGLNFYSMKEIKRIDYHRLASKFTFNAELMLVMLSLNLEVQFIPIVWKEEDQVSNAGNFSVAGRMIKALIRWRFYRLYKEPARKYKTNPIVMA